MQRECYLLETTSPARGGDGVTELLALKRAVESMALEGDRGEVALGSNRRYLCFLLRIKRTNERTNGSQECCQREHWCRG